MFNKKFKKIVIISILLSLVIFGLNINLSYANTLTSTNYNVEDFNILSAGGYSTSSNYRLESGIELVLSGQQSVPAPPQGGGGPTGPPAPPSDTTPPVISNVQATNITGTGATITWNTDESANSSVDYGLTTAYGSSTSSASLSTSHSMIITGLTSNQTYHFRVISKDASLNQVVSIDYTFLTVDVTAPIISNVQAINITQTGATIIWTTNENATSFTQYGLTTAYGSSTSTATLLTSHSMALTGFTANTLYHYKIKSKDTAQNEGVSADFTFTTLALSDTQPPIISNIQVQNISGTSATLTWTTNEPATSLVNYGTTPSYGKTASSTNLVTSHSKNLTELTPDTEYNFQLVSKDGANNIATSANNTFKTLDTIAPTISNIQATNITDSKVDISWITNEATMSKIFYRKVGDNSFQVFSESLLKVSHFNTITGLLGNLEYEFYIEATDAANNLAQSNINRFQTLKDNQPPTNVRNFTATPDDTINVLMWQLPPDLDYLGVFIVAGTDSYPKNIRTGRIVYVGPGISFTDTGLINGQKYYYTAFAYDTSINYSSGAIADGTPNIPGEIPIVPTPTPELESEEEPQVPTAPIVNLDAVDFWAANRTIKLQPNSSGLINMLTGASFGVSVDKNKIPQDAELVTLNIENSNYLLKENANKTGFDTDIVLPAIADSYNALITLLYADKQVQIPFSLMLKLEGVIFEQTTGAFKPLPDAIITLRQLDNGNWITWPAVNYFQDNPIISKPNGSYRFIVPNGIYYLEIKKEGYRTLKTNRVEVSKNYIDESGELLLLPKKITEIIDSEAPLTENIKAVASNIGEKAIFNTKVATEQVIKVAQNPVVENINNRIAAPTLVSVAVVNVATAIPALNIFNYLQYLLVQPFLFWNRKKRKGWGSVYNAFTKLPIDLAIIRLINFKTNRVARTVVTDRQGRYVLFAPQGEFVLTSTKSGFIFPSAYLKSKKEDESFVDLYYGSQFTSNQESQVITYNIPMDMVEEKVSLRRLIFKRVLKGLQFGIAISGIILTAVSFVVTPNIKIGIFFAIQIVMLILFMRLARPFKFKKWGMAKDEKTDKPLKNVIVRLHEAEYHKLLGTQVTDSKGRYAFLAGRNIYYLTFEKKGYKMMKSKNIDTRAKNKAGIITEKVSMEKEI